MEASNVFVYKVEEASYPKTAPFHPDKQYPEYQFEQTSNEANYVYESFRNLLNLMNLDKNKFNTPDWNPLKNTIFPGDRVVIKPNLVLNIKENQESITTHPSLIRAVVDYVLIALNGKGEIIIGDAPLQKCDFRNLIKDNGLYDLVKFYKTKNVTINLIDFRKERMIVKKNPLTKSLMGIKIDKLKGDPNGYTVVNLKNHSNLYPISQNSGYKKFRVTNYDPKVMRKAHNLQNHKYLISNSILHSTVVINLAKVKSHRKAGFTGCLKNSVGINGSKDWLPHHRKGSYIEGGDEYFKKSPIKQIYNTINEFEDLLLIYTPILYKTLYYVNFFLKSSILRIINKLEQENYLEGSWYGNDTLWRTIADLNQILLYADKKGKILELPQRKTLYFCDGIISGQSEGPLEPTAVNTGLILGGTDPLMIDLAIAELMNIDYKKVPQLYNLFKLNSHPISKYQPTDLTIDSNNDHWKSKKFSNIQETYNFKPSSGWEGKIKKNY